MKLKKRNPETSTVDLLRREKKDYIRKERYHGSFYRSFTLPDVVKEDNIVASFKDGVLKLVVPKAEVVKPKAIKVN